MLHKTIGFVYLKKEFQSPRGGGLLHRREARDQEAISVSVPSRGRVVTNRFSKSESLQRVSVPSRGRVVTKYPLDSSQLVGFQSPRGGGLLPHPILHLDNYI